MHIQFDRVQNNQLYKIKNDDTKKNVHELSMNFICQSSWHKLTGWNAFKIIHSIKHLAVYCRYKYQILFYTMCCKCKYFFYIFNVFKKCFIRSQTLYK